MKKMYVLDESGNKLFDGTRQDCKMFIRKNKVGRYRLTEKFVEKVALVAPTEEFEAEPDNDNNLAKPATKEGFFNRIF